MSDSQECTWENKCATPKNCRDRADDASVEHSNYVHVLREACEKKGGRERVTEFTQKPMLAHEPVFFKMCPQVYAYSYDDVEGLHVCSAQTKFEVCSFS